MTQLEEQESGLFPGGSGRYLLVVLAHGTPGRWAEGEGAIQMANAALTMEEHVTILLHGDGAYLAVRGRDASATSLPGGADPLQDFFDLGGRMLALDTSLERRGLTQGDLIQAVEVITPQQMQREVASHAVSVTF